MSLPDHDVAILGAGPVGSALALLLARVAPRPERIALFAPPPPSRTEPGTIDPRTLAMNHGSRVLLESLHAWPEHTADIKTVHVSQRGRLGRALISHDDLNVPRLGSVAPYTDLHEALSRAVAASGVTLIEQTGAAIAGHDARGATISTPSRSWSCALAVQADGSPGRDHLHDYGQHAVLATARASLPRQDWAWERFTREGPLALLPHPRGDGIYAVVWCCSPARAALLGKMSGPEFSAALNHEFGDRLGRFEAGKPDAVLPLTSGIRPDVVLGRTVVIGNAAQTLHPVAGQGLNLGLRDAARLALALQDWLAEPDADPGQRLARHARAREPDRRLSLGVTRVLPRLFATGLPAVEHACGLALLGLDLFPPARAPLARQLLQGLRF